MNNLSLSRIQRFVIYKNLGILNLGLNDYEKCIYYLEQALKYSENNIIKIYSCICHSYMMLKKTIPDIYLKLEDSSKGDRIDWLLYNYFKDMYTRTIED